MFNWKLWIKGLYAAVIGGAAASAATAVADPAAMGKPKELATVAGVGAAIGGLSYLKTHPPVDALPDDLEPIAAAGVSIAANKATRKLTDKTKKKP